MTGSKHPRGRGFSSRANWVHGVHNGHPRWGRHYRQLPLPVFAARARQRMCQRDPERYAALRDGLASAFEASHA